MYLFTAAQMKEIDRIAIEECGIPSTLLMERAAEAVVEQVLALPIPRKKSGREFVWFTRDGRMPDGQERAEAEEKFWAEHQPSAVVFCGAGNNGGDGVAAARLLLKRGWRVKCVLVGSREKMTEDCREMERRLLETGGVLEEFEPEKRWEYTGFDVAIDALFGIGLHSALRTDAVEAVYMMKQAMWTVSADIPSGVHADTGRVWDKAVKADVTVTFSAGKPGLFVGAGAVHSGRVVVVDIGIPMHLLEKQDSRTAVQEKPRLPRRKRDSHKGKYGKLFILAGSVGYTGAPVLAARAAVRTGAGLVTLAVPKEVYPIVAVKCDEAMAWPWDDRDEEVLQKAQGCNVAVIGPGLGQGDRARRLVLYLLEHLECPVILDADGLNIIAEHINVLDKRKGLTVLTPHDGEFARLSGCDLPIEDRLEAARTFAERHNCALILKGHRTITAAWTRSCVINPTGNPGMARGGAGDALAGMLGAMVCQLPRGDALSEAVWLHGRAGDLAAADKGEYGMTIGDLIEQIPYAMKECEEV